MQRPKGRIPDGAMILKAMNVFNNLNINENQNDGCMQISEPVQPNLWTPMIKSSDLLMTDGYG